MEVLVVLFRKIHWMVKSEKGAWGRTYGVLHPFMIGGDMVR